MIGKGSPQGKVKAQIDQLYLDAGHAVLWVKESGSGKPTGWKCLGIVVPTGDDSYRTSQSIRPRLYGCPG